MIWNLDKKKEKSSSTFKSQKKVWRRKKVNPDTGIKEKPNLSVSLSN